MAVFLASMQRYTALRLIFVLIFRAVIFRQIFPNFNLSSSIIEELDNNNDG